MNIIITVIIYIYITILLIIAVTAKVENYPESKPMETSFLVFLSRYLQRQLSISAKHLPEHHPKFVLTNNIMEEGRKKLEGTLIMEKLEGKIEANLILEGADKMEANIMLPNKAKGTLILKGYAENKREEVLDAFEFSVAESMNDKQE